MKKMLLLAVSLTAVLALTAQHFQVNSSLRPDLMPERGIDETLIKRSTMVNAFQLPAKPAVDTKAGGIVTIIDIGNSFNAFGLYNGGRTAIWADDNINSVSFVHRMKSPPGGGYLAYGLSTNGGMDWTTNIQVYNPTAGGGGQARYPQGGIYNPAGNTDPDNAYFAYFGCSLDATNGANWGGYVHGTHKLDQSTNPTQHYIPSTPDYYHLIPDAMTINQVTGEMFVVQDSYDLLTNLYTGDLIIARGMWNNTTNDYDFTESLHALPPFPGSQDYPVNIKIAFAPDGLTGYITLLWDNGLDPFATGYGLYPVILKTIDGGNTWSDPTAVIMSGPEGLYEIKYYLTDDQWNELWVNPELVHRDSVLYQTAFDHDLVVDMYGNPHICVTIGVASVDTPYSIIASGGFGATFHIFSWDQGQTWLAKHIQTNKTFRGAFADISEDNRSQISTTMDGSKVFLSWIDTDFEGVTDNIMPDIWCVGFDVETQQWTDVYNVTFLSEGWLEAFMGTASHYVFTDGNDYIIPLMYQTLVGGSPDAEVTFKYITDFVINQADFIIGNVDQIPLRHYQFTVSQNYPNPVSGTTVFAVELDGRVQLNVEIYNMVGQKVQAMNKGLMNSGRHLVQLDMSGYAPGIYFYTVKAADQTLTRKMIVH
jgi:hypothetical protein